MKETLKIALTGKGGIGKTMLTGLLAEIYANEGRPVLAIDANPDANLALAMGFSAEERNTLQPISEMKAMIEERTGAKPGAPGSYFRINPEVADIPDQYSLRKGNVKLMMMGTVKQASGGCMCPESALLKRLMSHMILERKEVVVMDMDAGVEHMGRGTTRHVDAFLVVVEPGQRSLQTAQAILRLAQGLGMKKCYIIGNKIRSEADRVFIQEQFDERDILGFIPFSDCVVAADQEGRSVYESCQEIRTKVQEIAEELEAKIE